MAAAKVGVRRKADEALQHTDHQHGHAGHDHEAEQTMQVGAADDAYEVAADKAADAAVRRLAEGGGLGESGAAFSAPSSTPGAIGAAGGSAGAETSARIAKARGGGSALPTTVRASMESAFGGANFGGVRLHQGEEAASLNSEVGAHAFTVGKDVFLGSSMPSLDSREGQHTLAHELAHTLQPAGGVHRFFRKKKTKQQQMQEALESNKMRGAKGTEGTMGTSGPSTNPEKTAPLDDFFDSGPMTTLGALKEFEGQVSDLLDMANTAKVVQDVGAKDMSDYFGSSANNNWFLGDKSGTGNNAFSGIGAGMDALDALGGGSDIITSGEALHHEKKGSIERNNAGRKMEGGVESLLSSGTKSGLGWAGVAGVSGLDPVSGYIDTAMEGKAMIQDSIISGRLGSEKSKIKRVQDQQMPKSVRMKRFDEFLRAFEAPRHLAAAKANLAVKDKAVRDLEAERDAFDQQITTTDTARNQAQTAYDERETKFDETYAELSKIDPNSGRINKWRHERLSTKLQSRQGKMDDAEAAYDTAKQQHEEAKKAKKEAFARKDSQGNKGAWYKSSRKDSHSGAKQRELDNAVKEQGQAQLAVTQAEAQAKAATKTKSKDLIRFEAALGDLGIAWDPANFGQLAYLDTPGGTPGDHLGLASGLADEMAKSKFLDDIKAKGYPDFGFGTDHREKFEKEFETYRDTQRSGANPNDLTTMNQVTDQHGNVTSKDDVTNYGVARGLGKVAKFGQRRKGETAGVHAVGAAGSALDATGTLTAGADFGATKTTGKVLKALKSTYEQTKKFGKRVHRAKKLADSRNKMEYGDKKDRGVGWILKMTFGGGDLEDHMDKNVEALESGTATTHKTVGGKQVVDKKGIKQGMDAGTIRQLMDKSKLQIVRRFEDLLAGLVNEDDSIRAEAQHIVRIISEGSISGRATRISDDELESIRTLYKAAQGKAKTSAEAKAYKKKHDALKDLFTDVLEGIGD